MDKVKEFEYKITSQDKTFNLNETLQMFGRGGWDIVSMTNCPRLKKVEPHREDYELENVLVFLMKKEKGTHD